MVAFNVDMFFNLSQHFRKLPLHFPRNGSTVVRKILAIAAPCGTLAHYHNFY